MTHGGQSSVDESWGKLRSTMRSYFFLEALSVLVSWYWWSGTIFLPSEEGPGRISNSAVQHSTVVVKFYRRNEHLWHARSMQLRSGQYFSQNYAGGMLLTNFVVSNLRLSRPAFEVAEPLLHPHLIDQYILWLFICKSSLYSSSSAVRLFWNIYYESAQHEHGQQSVTPLHCDSRKIAPQIDSVQLGVHLELTDKLRRQNRWNLIIFELGSTQAPSVWKTIRSIKKEWQKSRYIYAQ